VRPVHVCACKMCSGFEFEKTSGGSSACLEADMAECVARVWFSAGLGQSEDDWRFGLALSSSYFCFSSLFWESRVVVVTCMVIFEMALLDLWCDARYLVVLSGCGRGFGIWVAWSDGLCSSVD
jgi:hypothetical protein